MEVLVCQTRVLNYEINYFHFKNNIQFFKEFFLNLLQIILNIKIITNA